MDTPAVFLSDRLPLSTPQATSGSGSSLRVRPGRLSVALSAADGEGGSNLGEEVGDDDDTSSAVATKPKRKVNPELDDLVSEMAGRSDDEPVIIPRGAGIAPMAPGPIKPDPIPGMDGEPRVVHSFSRRQPKFQ